MSTPWFLFTPLVDIAALALWWGLLKLSRRRDNRRLRNGILFLLLAGSTVRALLHLASLIPALKIPVGLGGVAFFLLIALMPFLLMFNGVVLIRREGRRPRHHPAPGGRHRRGARPTPAGASRRYGVGLNSTSLAAGIACTGPASISQKHTSQPTCPRKEQTS